MAKYIKPVFHFVALAGATTSLTSGCDISGENKDILIEIFNEPNAFGSTESCEFPIESYCKFTSGDYGQNKAFTS